MKDVRGRIGDAPPYGKRKGDLGFWRSGSMTLITLKGKPLMRTQCEKRSTQVQPFHYSRHSNLNSATRKLTMQCSKISTWGAKTPTYSTRKNICIFFEDKK